MAFTCKNISSIAVAVLLTGAVLIPTVSRAQTQTEQFVTVAPDSGAANVVAFATKATFSSGAANGIAGNIGEKTNVPPGAVPLPATLGLLVLGIVGGLRARKKN
jgi:PEP-CTERM motif